MVGYSKRAPHMFLSLRQVEERLGLRPGGLSSAQLPPPERHHRAGQRAWGAAAGRGDARLAAGNDRLLAPDAPRTGLPFGYPGAARPRLPASGARLPTSAAVERRPIPAREIGEMRGPT
jgi:hypothetical protein